MAECPEHRVTGEVDGVLNGSAETEEELYRLHKAVFRGDVDESKAILNERNVNQEDVHG